MKNFIFNKTKSFVGRNTSDHACQIFCSKSNGKYVSLIFPPRDNHGQNNEQSECYKIRLRMDFIERHALVFKNKYLCFNNGIIVISTSLP
jgi:hypothetical protein